MAAYAAAEGGAEVHLYDKNPIIGKKLTYVPWETCEISHTGNTEDFMENYGRGAEFLQYSLTKFGFKDTEKFFKKLGIKLHINDDGIAAPPDNRSTAVQQAFEKKLLNLGVKFCISSKVQEVIADGKKITGLNAHNMIKDFDKVIIAAGGAARPKLGASGDGYRWARHLGHNVIEPKPAMAEVETEEKLGKYLSGVTVSPAIVTIINNQSRLLERNGSVTFTDHGVGGNTILFLSGLISRLSDNGKVEISIDLHTSSTRDQLERELKAESSINSRYTVKQVLKRYIPESMLSVLHRFCRVHENKPMSHITNLERKGLVLFIKDFRLTVKRVKPFYEALYTSGGVDVGELNPKSMESKLVKGLYFCGEVLDVDGGPGGYNFHSALSTGFIAGKAAARGAKSKKTARESAGKTVEETAEEAEKEPAPKTKKAAKKATRKKTAKKASKKKVA